MTREEQLERVRAMWRVALEGCDNALEDGDMERTAEWAAVMTRLTVLEKMIAVGADDAALSAQARSLTDLLVCMRVDA